MNYIKSSNTGQLKIKPKSETHYHFSIRRQVWWYYFPDKLSPLLHYLKQIYSFLLRIPKLCPIIMSFRTLTFGSFHSIFFNLILQGFVRIVFLHK